MKRQLTNKRKIKIKKQLSGRQMEKGKQKWTKRESVWKKWKKKNENENKVKQESVSPSATIEGRRTLSAPLRSVFSCE